MARANCSMCRSPKTTSCSIVEKYCFIPWTCCIQSFEFIECTISYCSFMTSKERRQISFFDYIIDPSFIYSNGLASLSEKWSKRSFDVWCTYFNVIVERWEIKSKNFVVLSVDVVMIRSSEILYWQVVIVDSCTWGIRDIIWPLAVSQIVNTLSRSVPEHNDLPSWESWQSVTICSWTPFH